MATSHSLLLTTDDAPGTLSRITRVIADHRANIRSIESLGQRDDGFTVVLELDQVADFPALRGALSALEVIRRIEEPPSLMSVYGKRVIIIGGGAQVGQVALGAISEADRHNIRGERISVDTIPLVGEEALASAVRAVIRLPRVRLLVLAGSIMGGDISRAVESVRQKGLYVISLNMAGSVPDVADLVVSDPVQAGVMAVMAVADTAKFDIVRQQKKRY